MAAPTAPTDGGAAAAVAAAHASGPAPPVGKGGSGTRAPTAPTDGGEAVAAGEGVVPVAGRTGNPPCRETKKKPFATNTTPDLDRAKIGNKNNNNCKKQQYHQ